MLLRHLKNTVGQAILRLPFVVCRISRLFVLAFVFLSFQAHAQQTTSYDSKQYFGNLYAHASATHAFEHRGNLSVSEWQHQSRKALIKLLGIEKIQTALPGYKPTARLEKTEKLAGFSREYWVINTEPNVPLTMIVLRPDNIKGLLPLVITPHGHGRNHQAYAGVYLDSADREHVLGGERDIALQSIREGYITIAPTARAFGDTRTENDIKEGKSFSCRIQLMQDLLVGRTPIGDRVWDLTKILDWAIDNLPVDTSRIAITGNSAGGTSTLFAAAIDTRYKVVVPSSYFSTVEGSIGVIAHCDCNYIPGFLDWGNISDVGGLIAPRPISVIHGVKDEIYPIEATRTAFKKLQKIYEMAGALQHARLYEGREGHRYYKAGAWDFVSKYFQQNQ